MNSVSFIVNGYSFEFMQTESSTAISTNLHTTGEGYINSPEREAAIDGLESMLLALFSHGMDMKDSMVQSAIADAIEAIDNHYED